MIELRKSHEIIKIGGCQDGDTCQMFGLFHKLMLLRNWARYPLTENAVVLDYLYVWMPPLTPFPDCCLLPSQRPIAASLIRFPLETQF